jgi:hypothetical protein
MLFLPFINFGYSWRSFSNVLGCVLVFLFWVVSTICLLSLIFKPDFLFS